MGYNKPVVPDAYKEMLETQLKRLASPEFEAFRKYLELELGRVMDGLATAEGVDRVYRLQGKYSALSQILNSINSHNRS